MELSSLDNERIASELRKQLAPEYLSSRVGAGGQKVFYITADKCINLANEIFGYNGWNSSIMETKVDFVSFRLLDRSQIKLTPMGTQVDVCKETGKISLGVSVVMRVTLKDGAYHEVSIPYIRSSQLS